MALAPDGASDYGHAAPHTSVRASLHNVGSAPGSDSAQATGHDLQIDSARFLADEKSLAR